MTKKMTKIHLTESLLRRGFQNGFAPEVSRDLLVHLGGGCLACSEAVRGFARRATLDVEPSSGAPPDPVVLALRRWVGVLRGEPFPAFVTPAHLFWAERLPAQTEAFPRVVVEEAFLTTLANHGADRSETLGKLVETLADSRFGQLGEKRCSDLQALSHAFLAWARREDWRALVEQATLAKDLLAEGSGDPEVCAVAYLHLSAAYGAALGSQSDLFDYTGEVERHLLRLQKTTKCPGHVADLRIHQGARLFGNRELEGALEKLTEGLGLVPGPCKWLRFFTVSKLAWLGFWLDRPKLLQRNLLEAEKLAERYFEEERGAVFRTRGWVEMKAGRFRLAEKKLRNAVDCFRRGGRRGKALDTLRDLHTVYLRSDRAEAAAGLRNDLRALVLNDMWPWEGKERDVLFQLAAVLDDLPWLRREFQVGEVVP